MAINVAELVATLRADTGHFVGAMSGAGASMKTFGSSAQASGMVLTKYLTLPLAGVAVAAIAAGVKYESALAGVAKTTSLTGASLEAFGEDVKTMSERLPAAATEILAVAESAGQLGVAEKDLLSFSETMIGLGESTNLGATEAATSLARFNNIFGESNDNVGRLGSTIVDLGNNFATTEAEIMDMSMRLAGASNTIGVSQTETLALATALSSVGIQAESGGSAFSRVMLEIQTAVDMGGTKLDTFAQTAGQTSTDFAKAFKDEPIKAIIGFVEGLERVRVEGGNTTQILDDLELDGIRVGGALRAAAGAGDLLEEAVTTANRAFEENVALTEEVNRRYETAAAQMEMFRNQVTNVAAELGAILVPILIDVMHGIEPLVDWLGRAVEIFGFLPGPVQVVAVALGAIAAAAGPVLFALGGVAIALEAMGVSASFATVAMSALPWVAVAAGAVILITAIDNLGASKRAAADRAVDLAAALLDTSASFTATAAAAAGMSDVGQEAAEALGKAGISLTDVVAISKTGTDAFHDLGDKLGTFNMSLGQSLGMLGYYADSVRATEPAAAAFIDNLRQMVSAGDLTVEAARLIANQIDETADSYEDALPKMKEYASGLAVAAGETHGLSIMQEAQAASSLKSAETVEDFNNILSALNDGFIMSAEGAGRYADAVELSNSITAAGIDELGGLYDATQGAAGSTDGLTDSVDGYHTAMKLSEEVVDGFINTQDALTAATSGATVSFEQFAEVLSGQTAALLGFQSNIDTLAAAGFPQIAEAISAMGPAGATAAQQAMEMVADGLTDPGMVDAEVALAAQALAILATVESTLEDGTPVLNGVGANMIREFAGGLESSNQAVRDAAAAAILAASPPGLQALVNVYNSVGLDAGLGLALGLSDQVDVVAAAALELANAATTGVKWPLAVASPSKVFIGIGHSVGEGLAIGITESEGGVLTSVGVMLDAVLGLGKGLGEWIANTKATMMAADLDQELVDLADAMGAAEDKVTTSAMAWQEALISVEIAQHRLGVAEREALEVTLEESAAIDKATNAHRDAAAAVEALRYEITWLNDEGGDSNGIWLESAIGVHKMEDSYNSLKQTAETLRWEIDLMSNTARVSGDMFIESAASIANAELGYFRAGERVKELTAQLEQETEQHKDTTETQLELTVAVISAEQANLKLATANHEATTTAAVLAETERALTLVTNEATLMSGALILSREGMKTVAEKVAEKEGELSSAQIQTMLAQQALTEAQSQSVGTTDDVIKAAGALKEAQDIAKEASEKHQTAVRDLAQAQVDIQRDMLNVMLKIGEMMAKGEAWRGDMGKTGTAFGAMGKSVISEADRLKLAINSIPTSKTITITTVSKLLDGGTQTLTEKPNGVNEVSIVGGSVPGLGFTYGGTQGGFGGGKAAGGPVYAGQSYLVGESGVEILTMGAGGGNVIPNHQVGGGGPAVTNININVAGDLDPASGERVVEKLRAYNRQNGPIPVNTRGGL